MNVGKPEEACRDNVFAICDNGFLWVGMIGLP